MPTSSDTIYHSDSKGDVRIGDMASPWIANALRKIGEDAEMKEVRRAMWAELVERGCVFDHETDQWTFPPKPEADNG